MKNVILITLLVLFAVGAFLFLTVRYSAEPTVEAPVPAVRPAVSLAVGDRAPEFELPDQTGQLHSLEDYRDQWVVLYFYPKDDTPGCTIEANQFTQLASEFAEADTVVLGVSKDSCASHQTFIDKYGLKVDLLADSSGQLCDAYGVWQEKEKNGVKKMGIVRSTFVIDAQGVVRHALYNVTPKGHAAQILELVKAL